MSTGPLHILQTSTDGVQPTTGNLTTAVLKVTSGNSKLVHIPSRLLRAVCVWAADINKPE